MSLSPESARGASDTPAPADSDAPDVEAQWETCEIRCDYLKGGVIHYTYAFCAEAVGPKGRYRAGTSVPFKARFNRDPDAPWGRQNPGTNAAWAELIATLGRDGWEPAPPADLFWYSYRFRRPLPVGA
jgi:hypothetical protein